MIIDKNNLENKTLVDLIQPQNKIILEIGCGKGDIAKLLSPLCQKYIGIDVDKSSINQAKKSAKNFSNLTFHLKSGDQTEFEKETFDVVLMHLCLHEVPPQKQGLVLKETHRVLKKGGQLLIIDPTEPPGQVQALYNIGYRFLWFDHSTVVQHSIKVIDQAISAGLYQLKLSLNLKIDFTFNNLQELQNLIQGDFYEVIWSPQNKKILIDELLKITKNKTENITLIDDLTVTNLIKI